MLAAEQLIPEIPLDEWTNSAVGWITETFESVTSSLSTR